MIRRAAVRVFVFCLYSALCLLPSALAGCADREDAPTLTVYTSVDQPYARPILDDFQKQTGIRVVLQTDTEATKSVGLAERLRAEKANPQADVWWGNEVFHTINLAEEGLLQPYESPAAADIPELFKDPQHRWAGNGLRARVIAVHSKIPSTQPFDFQHLDVLKQTRVTMAMARPTAGTTGGHVAALYVLWGDDVATQFFRSLRANDIKLLGGNAAVADAVGLGSIWVGFTDNDDVAAARRNGGSLHMVLPDQDTFGTLTIPTTVGLVAGARHPDTAKQLIDYLLSPEVERRLIEAQFAGWSVRGGGEQPIKPMQVDYREVARVMPEAVRRATAILEGRE